MNRLMYLLFAALLFLQVSWAQAAPPIDGVKGKLQSVTGDSLVVQTPKGPVEVKIQQPLTTYGRVPSDLSHVNSSSFVGVTSIQQPNGTEQAKEIHIFPSELRGAGEGSNIIEPSSHSRMTNGSVSKGANAGSSSRMTNGTVEKQGGGTKLVVQYQNGAQTIAVPSGIEVTQIVPKKQKLEAGDTIYAATSKGPDGKLTTNKVYVISSKTGSK